MPAITTSSVFAAYEDEYLAEMARAQEHLEKVHGLLPGSERKALAATARDILDAADELCRSMELEALSLGGAARKAAGSLAKSYKASVLASRAQLKGAAASSRAEQQARAELLEGASPSLRAEADEQRGRLLASTEKLERSTEALGRACSVAMEAEQAGVGILDELEAQRRTIDAARGRIGAATAGLDRSKRLLVTMGKRAFANKLLMHLMIGALVLLILFLVYAKFFFRAPRASEPTDFGPVGAEREPRQSEVG